ncbi:hypothetical protein [Streptomyces abyssomicinicus]|uniref:hypothetical protein n=1 Tax=Streptomyces abyssomicinicus TaxID=574929 RepID=UPI0013E03479|nr:hypothetical protein [Streptomyces abyssomicinicus]
MRTAVPVTITVTGLALMAFMIVVEGEPGALPLALIALGAGWFGLARVRRGTSRRG